MQYLSESNFYQPGQGRTTLRQDAARRKCEVTIADLFAEEIDDEVRSLVKERILAGGNLARRGCDRRKAKLALLLVLELTQWKS